MTVTPKKRQVTNKEPTTTKTNKDLSKTSHCRLKVVYLPWQEHRPYDGGFAYNCLLARFQLGSNQSEVEVRYKSNPSPNLEPRDFPNMQQITDEECGSKFCLSCRLETPTLRLLVRGLCSDSIFEQVDL